MKQILKQLSRSFTVESIRFFSSFFFQFTWAPVNVVLEHDDPIVGKQRSEFIDPDWFSILMQQHFIQIPAEVSHQFIWEFRKVLLERFFKLDHLIQFILHDFEHINQVSTSWFLFYANWRLDLHKHLDVAFVEVKKQLVHDHGVFLEQIELIIFIFVLSDEKQPLHIMIAVLQNEVLDFLLVFVHIILFTFDASVECGFPLELLEQEFIGLLSKLLLDCFFLVCFTGPSDDSLQDITPLIPQSDVLNLLVHIPA